jgi:CMP-N,N'-diacetyllegionaminic acid synthase
MDILGIIPARGGSQGFPQKNIQMLLGKPVIAYTILAAQKSRLITRLTVSTEDREIAEVSRQYGAEVVIRPMELAADDSPIDDALRHVVTYLKEKEGYYPHIVAQMQANVPVRKEGMIDKVIKKVIDTGADSAISVYEVDQIPEMMKILDGDKLIPRYGLPEGYRRQDYPTLYLADGAVMATRIDVLFETIGDKRAHAYLGDNVRGVVQEKYYTIELDSPEDLVLAEAIMNVLNAKKRLDEKQ